MDEKEFLAKLKELAFVAEPGAASELAARSDAQELLDRVVKKLAASSGFVVTKKIVAETIEEKEAEQKSSAAVVIVEATNYKPPAKDIEARVKIRHDLNMPSKSTCTGTVDDFVEYFKDRYKKATGVLKGWRSENGVTPIGKLKSLAQWRSARIIGMVADKRETKNGHLIIELEDEEDSVTCLVPKDSPLMQEARQVVNDEVIAVDGVMSGTLFIIKKDKENKGIIWPGFEIPPEGKKNLADEDISIAFISDTHFGSRYFLQDHFQKFIRFLNGEGSETERELAGKIKYLFVAGDIVDGIGVYPSQEKELVTKDIYMQYEMFAEAAKNIPEYIQVVVIPGNHDAVRVAEPQPVLLPEFTKSLDGYSNIHFLPNPGFLEVHGLKALLYHGGSLVSMIENNPALSGGYQNPEKVGVELLKRRHLSPIYGENPIVPERRDYLAITEVPDILHFGHVHKNGYEEYRGKMVINSGTWQDVTDYQIKQGHVPSPCELPIYNLMSGSLSVRRFKEV